MAKVRKLHGKWYLDYRDARGKRRRQVAKNCKNKREAELALLKKIGQVERGGAGDPRITLKDYAKRWLERKLLTVKSTTVEEYRSKVNLYLCNEKYGLGEVRLTRINKPLIEDFQLDMRKANPKLSPRTCNVTIVILGGILQSALKDGLIEYNPARLVDKMPQPKKEMDFLIPEELNALFKGARIVSGELELMIRLSVFSGIRLGEMLALRWQDVDLVGRRLFVRRTYRDGMFGEPKSERSRRTVNLPPGVCQSLRERRMAEGNPEGDALIFHRGDGQPWIPSHVSPRLWRRALRAAGLRESLRWHDMRHTFATLLMNQGESVKYIQAQLGHASGQVTMDVYSHLMPDAGRDATDRLEAVIDS